MFPFAFRTETEFKMKSSGFQYSRSVTLNQLEKPARRVMTAAAREQVAEMAFLIMKKATQLIDFTLTRCGF
ncbi:MAG: hypothetical protein ACUVS7_06345 [Bryobacteraceae bacterium]